MIRSWIFDPECTNGRAKESTRANSYRVTFDTSLGLITYKAAFASADITWVWLHFATVLFTGMWIERKCYFVISEFKGDLFCFLMNLPRNRRAVLILFEWQRARRLKETRMNEPFIVVDCNFYQPRGKNVIFFPLIAQFSMAHECRRQLIVWQFHDFIIIAGASTTMFQSECALHITTSQSRHIS